MTASRLHGLLSSYLDDIRRHFKRDTKVTLVVRDPTDPTGEHDVVIGNDEWSEAIRAIKRMRAREGAER